MTFVIIEWRLDSVGAAEYIYQSRKGRSFSPPPAKDCWKTQIRCIEARNKILDDNGYDNNAWDVHDLTGPGIPQVHENTSGRFLSDKKIEFWKNKVLSNESRINDLEEILSRIERSFT